MKTLIICNNFNWDLGFKLAGVKYFFESVRIIDFTVEVGNFKSIPHQKEISSPNSFGNTITFQKIDSDWYDKNISIPARDRGFDCVIFLQEPKEYKGSPAQGYRTHNNLVIQEIVAQAKKKGSYNYCGAGLKGDQLTWILIHELLHAFYLKENKLDNTHKWFSAKTPEKCLEDFKMKTPYAVLKRISQDNKQTLGELTILKDGKTFTCKTLELPDFGNQKNISCIPKGVYSVEKSYSLKFGMIYRVNNVPNRSGILIHTGNFYTDIKGCIIIGNEFKDINNDGLKDVINSKKTLKALMEFLGDENFNLVIN